jgi:hypothetical protein
MSTAELTATVTRALLTGLQRHGKSQWGTVVDVPHTVQRGDYAKVTGYFGLADVACDIAAAVEATQEKQP